MIPTFQVCPSFDFDVVVVLVCKHCYTLKVEYFSALGHHRAHDDVRGEVTDLLPEGRGLKLV